MCKSPVAGASSTRGVASPAGARTTRSTPSRAISTTRYAHDFTGRVSRRRPSSSSPAERPFSVPASSVADAFDLEPCSTSPWPRMERRGGHIRCACESGSMPPLACGLGNFRPTLTTTRHEVSNDLDSPSLHLLPGERRRGWFLPRGAGRSRRASSATGGTGVDDHRLESYSPTRRREQ